MRRLVILTLLFILPLQFAWAAVLGYTAHRRRPGALGTAHAPASPRPRSLVPIMRTMPLPGPMPNPALTNTRITRTRFSPPCWPNPAWP
jgi:hypothetical protein